MTANKTPKNGKLSTKSIKIGIILFSYQNIIFKY